MRKMGYLPGVAIDDTAMEQPGLLFTSTITCSAPFHKASNPSPTALTVTPPERRVVWLSGTGWGRAPAKPISGIVTPGKLMGIAIG
jgi:hypothetical protein